MNLSELHASGRAEFELNVVSKCANPACASTFHFLHEGRIFTVILGNSASTRHDDAAKRRVEHFWRCNECARTMTLSYSSGEIMVRNIVQEPQAPTLVLKKPPGHGNSAAVTAAQNGKRS